MSIYVQAKVRHWKWKIESGKSKENTLSAEKGRRKDYAEELRRGTSGREGPWCE